jgi:hypothetical protein
VGSTREARIVELCAVESMRSGMVLAVKLFTV